FVRRSPEMVALFAVRASVLVHAPDVTRRSPDRHPSVRGARNASFLRGDDPRAGQICCSTGEHDSMRRMRDLHRTALSVVAFLGMMACLNAPACDSQPAATANDGDGNGDTGGGKVGLPTDPRSGGGPDGSTAANDGHEDGDGDGNGDAGGGDA